MNITATVTVTLATVEVKDRKPETRTSDIKLYSCDALSDAKIDPKAVIVSVEQ